MSGTVGDLSPKQADILGKFKENVKDILKPNHDDYHLTKWLRARDFDLQKAEAAIRNDAAWRNDNNVDTILEDYKVPEVIEKYFVGGICGRDKEGCPIWIDTFGDLDIRGMLCSAKKQDILKSKVHLLERINNIFTEESTPERRVEGLVVIIDLEKMGMKHLWKPGMDMMNSILAMFEEHYPETLKISFAINAPRIFPIIYNLARPFLNENTIKKVHVLGADYKQVLLKYIDPDQLPVYWGGTKTDPDGNPKCPSLINLGGDIPSSYFCNVLNDLDGFTQVDIGRGSSLQLDYEITVKRSVIRYQFKTDGFDLGFGIYRRTRNKRQSAGDMAAVMASERVNSHLVPEDGSFTCKETGTYVVRFDNTYSWTRGKKLFYLIEILEPDVHDLDIQDDTISELSNSSDKS
ncbi:hypothetical protein LOTGIDRAFT_163396 [Lottia gigantea]|uniref:CRAL-TRIO domain-containing protein n=1 Tax=Lottia gigantea TaxID=225164 RepID=V3ZK42_LOTGI|nr:hypothetical protein LOTGIDRAFT_163396 [Lottia gigantea]ESO91668.1 hypothetical protein LOTGIDRAFT_163396 [Lottia gigantea]